MGMLDSCKQHQGSQNYVEALGKGKGKGTKGKGGNLLKGY